MCGGFLFLIEFFHPSVDSLSKNCYICKNNCYFMNKNILEFVAFCISGLALRLNLSQNEVYSRLKGSGILDNYIIPSYDVLHTFSARYLMDDLAEYMEEKGVFPK